MKITNVILLVILCSDVSAVTLEGKVVSVHDGDTITILGASRRQHRIRLAEIDAPGISQAFGNQSKKSLSDIVFGKSVKVVQDDVDRYRRVVGRVYVNGIDVSAEQVSRGMTWVYRKYATDKGLYVFENSAKTSSGRSVLAAPEIERTATFLFTPTLNAVYLCCRHPDLCSYFRKSRDCLIKLSHV